MPGRAGRRSRFQIGSQDGGFESGGGLLGALSDAPVREFSRLGYEAHWIAEQDGTRDPLGEKRLAASPNVLFEAHG
ncbi:hypothetical protein ACFRI7_00410 [Streptomyces sp. NPDC056716]|uniref:hypothetical protein n=1 Tax=unclassified Streptomyces TaxID=2593676 RepID=UPI0036B4667F